MKTALILISVFLLVFLLLALVFGGICFYSACDRKARLIRRLFHKNEPRIFGCHFDQVLDGQKRLSLLPGEEVFIQSKDGLKLHGRLLHGKNASRTLLCVHGYRATPFHDFGAATDILLSFGNLLLIDQRAHSQSEGRYITYGVRESEDCCQWAEWLLSKKGAEHPVYLDGISMGATTVLMAAPRLPHNVRGIIADCGFTSPYDIMKDITCRYFFLPQPLLLFTVDLFCRRIARFSLREKSTLSAMEENSLPVLFVHGTADSLVPVHMTEEAYNACHSPKKLLLCENAEHGMSFFAKQDQYLAAMNKLFSDCEKERKEGIE